MGNAHMYAEIGVEWTHNLTEIPAQSICEDVAMTGFMVDCQLDPQRHRQGDQRLQNIQQGARRREQLVDRALRGGAIAQLWESDLVA